MVNKNLKILILNLLKNTLNISQMDKKFIRFRKYYELGGVNTICEKGDLNGLKWKNKYNLSFSANYIYTAIEYNRFEMVKWIHHNREEPFTNISLQVAAETGNLEMVKWIYDNITYIEKFEIDLDSISFHLNNRYLCGEIIKWLPIKSDRICGMYGNITTYQIEYYLLFT